MRRGFLTKFDAGIVTALKSLQPELPDLSLQALSLHFRVQGLGV